MSTQTLSLVDLPLEIIETILANLCTHCRIPKFHPEKQMACVDSRDVHALLDLSLTCKTLCRLSQPMLFHAPRMGESMSKDRLFSFLRALTLRPDLAMTVKTLFFDVRFGLSMRARSRLGRPGNPTVLMDDNISPDQIQLLRETRSRFVAFGLPACSYWTYRWVEVILWHILTLTPKLDALITTRARTMLDRLPPAVGGEHPQRAAMETVTHLSLDTRVMSSLDVVLLLMVAPSLTSLSFSELGFVPTPANIESHWFRNVRRLTVGQRLCTGSLDGLPHLISSSGALEHFGCTSHVIRRSTFIDSLDALRARKHSLRHMSLLLGAFDRHPERNPLCVGSLEEFDVLEELILSDGCLGEFWEVWLALNGAISDKDDLSDGEEIGAAGNEEGSQAGFLVWLLPPSLRSLTISSPRKSFVHCLYEITRPEVNCRLPLLKHITLLNSSIDLESPRTPAYQSLRDTLVEAFAKRNTAVVFKNGVASHLTW